MKDRTKIMFMRFGIVMLYQLILLSTSFIMALFLASPLAMGFTCIILKTGFVPATGYFGTWLIITGAVTLPLYITEEVLYVRRRKELVANQVAEKDKAIQNE